MRDHLSALFEMIRPLPCHIALSDLQKICEMLRAKDHPVSNFCIRCTQSLREYDRKKFGHAGFGVIDSVIMMACLYPDLMVEPYSAYCDIEISHTLAYGYFSIDKHHQLHHADNCTVCSKVEAEGYKRHLFHLLSD